MAARLVGIEPGVLAQVQLLLADDPLADPAERVAGPISVAALIVSIASLGWTVYHDIRKDHAAAGLAQSEKIERLKAHLRDQTVRPAGLLLRQHDLILTVIAEEIIGSDASG